MLCTIHQLLHFAKARPASNTGLLCHFPVKTLQKVQELGQMGFVGHSTPSNTIKSHYFNSFIELIFNFTFDILNLSCASNLSLIG
jgi:hypothetical protein